MRLAAQNWARVWVYRFLVLVVVLVIVQAMAMGDTGLPHAVRFVLERDGRVLDGKLLHEAIEHIDAAASPAPHFYSISCVHPSIAAAALRDEAVFSDLVARRLLEFKANASPLSTGALVKLDHPEGDAPERFATELWEIHEDYGLRVLGGCCGTDDRHVMALPPDGERFRARVTKRNVRRPGFGLSNLQVLVSIL